MSFTSGNNSIHTTAMSPGHRLHDIRCVSSSRPSGWFVVNAPGIIQAFALACSSKQTAIKIRFSSAILKAFRICKRNSPFCSCCFFLVLSWQQQFSRRREHFRFTQNMMTKMRTRERMTMRPIHIGSSNRRWLAVRGVSIGRPLRLEHWAPVEE